MTDKQNKFPERAMSVFRNRLGLSEDDTSKDDVINQYAPDYAFRELCAWHLGSKVWADNVVYWLNQCGLEVKSK